MQTRTPFDPHAEQFTPRSDLKLHWRHREQERREIQRHRAAWAMDMKRKELARNKWTKVKRSVCGTLTMKQSFHGLAMTEVDAEREWHNFRVRLNRKVHRHAYRSGHKSLVMTVIHEYGEKNGQLHLHFHIEWPADRDFDFFSREIYKTWRKSTVSLRHFEIDITEDPIDWEIYIGKENTNESFVTN